HNAESLHITDLCISPNNDKVNDFSCWASVREVPAAEDYSLRRLAFRHDRVADGCVWRRLCPRRSERFHLPLLDLFLCSAIAQADFVLLGLEPKNLEIVFLPLSKHGGHARPTRRFFVWLVAIAFRATLFNLRDVAKPFDAFRQLDERAEIGGARHFAANYFVQFVRAEPVRPDVVQLLDTERKAAIFGVHLENFGLYGV